MNQRFRDLDDWAESDSWGEPGAASALREVLHEDYADADDEALEDALEAVLDGMSDAEAFTFEKALRQLQRGAGQLGANPLVGQALRTALPAGAGALGTLVGGPVGTAVGSQIGTRAAAALGRSSPPAAGKASPAAVATGGSTAALKGLSLMMDPAVSGAIAASIMGQHGARKVGGVPVASIMNLLSSVFGQAAADADELAYLDGEELAP